MLQTTRRLPKPRHHNSPKTSTASRISQFYTHRLQAYAFGFQPSSLVLKSHNSFLISAYSGCRAQEILCQINKSVRWRWGVLEVCLQLPWSHELVTRPDHWVSPHPCHYPRPYIMRTQVLSIYLWSLIIRATLNIPHIEALLSKSVCTGYICED